MTAETMEMNDWDWGPWGGYPMAAGIYATRIRSVWNVFEQ